MAWRRGPGWAGGRPRQCLKLWIASESTGRVGARCEMRSDLVALAPVSRRSRTPCLTPADPCEDGSIHCILASEPCTHVHVGAGELVEHGSDLLEEDILPRRRTRSRRHLSTHSAHHGERRRPCLGCPDHGPQGFSIFAVRSEERNGGFFYRFLRLAKTFCGKKIISASFFP